MLPIHDPNVCVWKAGQWECLHAVDADHFYLGDFLVDLVQLRWQEQQAAKDYDKFTGMQCHGIGQSLNALAVYALNLSKMRFDGPVSVGAVKFSLKKLNQLGISTGYPPFDEITARRKER